DLIEFHGFPASVALNYEHVLDKGCLFKKELKKISSFYIRLTDAVRGLRPRARRKSRRSLKSNLLKNLHSGKTWERCLSRCFSSRRPSDIQLHLLQGGWFCGARRSYP